MFIDQRNENFGTTRRLFNDAELYANIASIKGISEFYTGCRLVRRFLYAFLFGLFLILFAGTFWLSAFRLLFNGYPENGSYTATCLVCGFWFLPLIMGINLIVQAVRMAAVHGLVRHLFQRIKLQGILLEGIVMSVTTEGDIAEITYQFTEDQRQPTEGIFRTKSPFKLTVGDAVIVLYHADVGSILL